MLLKSFIIRLAALVLLAGLPCVTLGQLARPAAEYHSLMKMRFSEDNGEFWVEGLQIVFPPRGDERAELIVSRASGEEVISLPLRFESHSSSPIFGELVPSETAGEIKLGEAGAFVLTIKVGDREITRLPFSLSVELAGDPYGPPRRFLREGPWRDLAYFSVPIGSPGAHVDFNWWMSLRELPSDATNSRVTIRLMRGGQEIARSPDSVAVSSIDWQPFTTELIRTTKAGTQYLTLGELAKRDGDCLLIVEANSKPIKSYRVEVEGGRLQRADQSRLDFEPHVDFISPRLIDTSARSDSTYPMRDVYWVRRSAVTATFAQRWNSK